MILAVCCGREEECRRRVRQLKKQLVELRRDKEDQLSVSDDSSHNLITVWECDDWTLVRCWLMSC